MWFDLEINDFKSASFDNSISYDFTFHKLQCNFPWFNDLRLHCQYLTLLDSIFHEYTVNNFFCHNFIFHYFIFHDIVIHNFIFHNFTNLFQWIWASKEIFLFIPPSCHHAWIRVSQKEWWWAEAYSLLFGNSSHRSQSDLYLLKKWAFHPKYSKFWKKPSVDSWMSMKKWTYLRKKLSFKIQVKLGQLLSYSAAFLGTWEIKARVTIFFLEIMSCFLEFRKPNETV